MDPASLIPAPDAIPVHWSFLQVLLTGTTFLHFMAMNIMLGTGVIALASFRREGTALHAMRRDIARTLPFTIAFTLNLGVAPLLFLQVLYGQFFYTSSILMAVYWLAIVLLLIIAYYAAYIFDIYYEQPGEKAGGGPLFIGLAVFLLLIVSLLFCNNISIMQLPQAWEHYFADRDGWLFNSGDPALVPRYLHFIFSAMAMGGLAIAFYYEIRRRCCGLAEERLVRHGCNWFTVATIINFGIGFWFLGTIPAAAYSSATLGGKFFTFMLIATVIATVKAVINAQVARIFPAAAWALLAVLFMTVARDLLRLAYLKPYFSLADLPVHSQYSPFILFLVFLVGAGFIVRWMMRSICCETCGKEVQQ